MRSWFGKLARFIFVLCCARIAPSRAAEEVQPPPATPQAKAKVKAESPRPSLVFPNGFPSFPSEEKVAESHPIPPVVKEAETEAKYPAILPDDSNVAPYDYAPNDFDEGQGSPLYLSDYGHFSGPFPDYYYDPAYYNAYGIGARALADYAPPGYETRDYQDAPGDPEYTQITPPPPISAEQRATFVTRGMFPGSFLVPGTNTSFRFRGFVRLTGLFDFQPIGSTDSFVPNTIPVPQQSGQNFNMTARISRFAIESWTPTSFHEWNVHTFIEGDFFNGPPQAVGGGANPLRLRHAFIDFGYFRVGQQNTVYMDANNWPSLVDFQGPNGWINQRQPSARMTIPLVDQWYWATSVERPFSDITTNGMGTNVQDVPDFATHLRFEATRGHAQVGSLLRTIGYRPTDGDVTRRAGIGVSGSVVIHPWAILMGTDPVHEANPSGLTRTRMLVQGTWGPGTGRYVNDLAGQGFDGQVNPLTGAFNTVDATGWHASYEHWYTESWLSNFTYSQARADSDADQPGTTYERGQYVAASLWWIPLRRMSLGFEYLWGRRENIDGQAAETNRLNGLFQYNF